jgi:hypothetical protein
MWLVDDVYAKTRHLFACLVQVDRETVVVKLNRNVEKSFVVGALIEFMQNLADFVILSVVVVVFTGVLVGKILYLMKLQMELLVKCIYHAIIGFLEFIMVMVIFSYIFLVCSVINSIDEYVANCTAKKKIEKKLDTSYES